MKGITIEDRMYCRNCVYTAPDTEAHIYLCNYYLQTGKRRGCPAGAGCTKKKEEPAKK